ncbi:hypothetical protein TheveDRAFT_0051 [Thermanaerovibrio velox DSM 12556]|uniref:Uncharacterized protein n=1 Tax=Thermanaerovibrio velox DSM 12556 TaxID=926567 RepID=H0UMU5_9BACT|nr:hypothetical protein [Thermanaerovibrio velox]EHM09240.1 hypothetical protein TheveDRAFT_0051 [Thermanaerovibrio velox DSM 12556]
MKRRVVVFYEHFAREYDTCKMIKNKLENTGEFIVEIFSIAFEYCSALAYARDNKTDILVMPWLYTLGDYKLCLPFLVFNSDMIIFNLHHEQVSSPMSERANLGKDLFVSNRVFHVVWGDLFESKLLSLGIPNNIIFKVGYLRGDAGRYFHGGERNKVRSELAMEFGLDPQKRWILFAENRDTKMINNKELSHLLRMGYDKEDVLGYVDIKIKSLKKTFDDFSSLPDSFFENNEIIYRMHPGMLFVDEIKKMKWFNRIKVINSYSIYKWLSAVDVNVVWNSTSIFESDAMGVLSLRYDPLNLPSKYLAYGLDLYPVISSIGQVDCLPGGFANKGCGIYSKFIGAVDSKSFDRLVDYFYLALNKNNICRNNEICVLDDFMMFLTKKYLFELLAGLFSKFRILSIFKYPKTAYKLRDDIPSNPMLPSLRSIIHLLFELYILKQ